LVAKAPTTVGQNMTRPTGPVSARRRSARVSRSTSSSVATPVEDARQEAAGEVDDATDCLLADAEPEKLAELINIWFAQAGANGAFPLDDRSPVEILMTPRPQLTAPRDRYVASRSDVGVLKVPLW
jgi:hypothetical protein